MIWNENNGFAVNMEGALDMDSIKVLYPEYYVPENSPTYVKWEKERDATGICQSDFCKKEGISDFRKVVGKERTEIGKRKDLELQKRFDAFVAEHKDEIYQAQLEAIKKNKESADQYQKAIYDLSYENYERCMLAYKTGNEVLVKLDDIKLINNILSLGYKVKSFYNDICCLEFGKDTLLSWDDIKRVFPFDQDVYSGKSFGGKRPVQNYYKAEVRGVSFDPEQRLLGYEYPDVNNEDMVW